MLFPTIVADPPWPIPQSNRRSGRRLRSNGTTLPYPVMNLDDIAALRVSDLALPDAHLYLWVTTAFNRDGTGKRIAEAWGFRVVSEIVWEKPNTGMGLFPRSCHEIVLICKRGKLLHRLRNIRSVQLWSQHGEGMRIHSAKPPGFYDLVERASPGPFLELFSRRKRSGWEVLGDAIDGRDIREVLGADPPDVKD